jgi:A/G-specific adenine glycosylase
MLQQTQVSTVVPYFARFLERFPTASDLAAAPRDDVLKLWQGLGYYRRAANLHRAAVVVVNQHAGRVPRDERALRRLPGVGRYIASAIRSLAFNEPAPIVEANVARMLARLFAISEQLGDAATQKRLWELSERLLSKRDPALHNQAIMELGALVCVPGQPRCERCPLIGHCAAYEQGVAGRLPSVRPRRTFVEVEDAAVVVRRRGRVLIVRRPEHGRWGGLWELPRTSAPAGRDPRDCLAEHVRDSLGLTIRLGPKLLHVKHGVTHHRITLVCYACASVAGRLRVSGYHEARWEFPHRLHEYAFSSPQRRLIAAVAPRTETPHPEHQISNKLQTRIAKRSN